MTARSRTIAQLLAASGLVPVDARVLLGHALGCDRAWLAAHGDAQVEADASRRFDELARKRRDGEPVAYLVGRREFHGLELEVSRDVLIPRPETETLVNAAVEALSRRGQREPGAAGLRVLDLGTGSGAVALAIARACPAAQVVATDVSPAALALARRNADQLRIANVRFALSDWFAAVPVERFDLVVANPPYIADGDPHLEQGDLRCEPALALRGGADGLRAIAAIVAAAPGHLAPHGELMLEHGHDQAARVRVLLHDAGWSSCRSLRDLAGIERVAIATRFG